MTRFRCAMFLRRDLSPVPSVRTSSRLRRARDRRAVGPTGRAAGAARDTPVQRRRELRACVPFCLARDRSAAATAQVSSRRDTQLRRVPTTDARTYESRAPRRPISLRQQAGTSVCSTPEAPTRRAPVALTDGEAIEGVNFALPRGAVIAGRVTDEFGEPIASAQVQVQRHQYGPDGQRRAFMTGMATSDDRGEFRVFGLMPGEYVVNAGVRTVNMMPAGAPNPNDVNEGYPPTYYPGTINPAEAQTSVCIGRRCRHSRAPRAHDGALARGDEAVLQRDLR